MLPHAKSEEVATHAKNLISIFAPGGGYVFAAVHAIPGNTPPENIATTFKTAFEYGKYPIM